MNDSTPQPRTILLIGMPAWGCQQPFFALALVAGIVKQAGWRPTVADLNIEVFKAAAKQDQKYWESDYAGHWLSEGFASALYEKYRSVVEGRLDALLAAAPYDLIGFSVNKFTRHMTLPAARYAAQRCPTTPIMFGGPDCFPREHGTRYLAEGEPVPQLILQGEAEVALPEFLREFAQRNTWRTQVPGFAFKQGGLLVDNGEPALPDLQTQTARADFTQFAPSDYAIPGRFYTFLSRGCVNRCAFCNERSNFRRYRYRKAADVFAEIRDNLPHFAACGTRPFVDFADSMANASVRELESLCDLVIESGIHFSWGVQTHFRPQMTLALLEKMQKAGCAVFFWGLESASQRVLDLMGKNYSIAEAQRIIEDTSALGMKSHLALVVGFPGETAADLVTTARFVLRHRDTPKVISKSIAACMIKPNTRLFSDPAAFGIDEASPALAGDDPTCSGKWWSRDRRNSPQVRLVRRFVLNNAANNASLTMQDCADLDTLAGVDFNDLYVAAEIAATIYLLSHGGRRDKEARHFLEAWQGEAVWRLPTYEPWLPQGLPADIDWSNWFSADKNCGPARLRVVTALLEALRFAYEAARGSDAHAGGAAATTAAHASGETLPAPEERLYQQATTTLYKWAANAVVSQPSVGPPTSLANTAEGLAVAAHDNDPHLILPAVEMADQDALAVCIDISVPAHTRLQLFFGTRSHAGFVEEHSETRFVRKGRNRLYILAGRPELTGHLRLDPGEVPGAYLVHHLEVRRLAPLRPAAERDEPASPKDAPTTLQQWPDNAHGNRIRSLLRSFGTRILRAAGLA